MHAEFWLWYLCCPKCGGPQMLGALGQCLLDNPGLPAALLLVGMCTTNCCHNFTNINWYNLAVCDSQTVRPLPVICGRRDQLGHCVDPVVCRSLSIKDQAQFLGQLDCCRLFARFDAESCRLIRPQRIERYINK